MNKYTLTCININGIFYHLYIFTRTLVCEHLFNFSVLYHKIELNASTIFVFLCFFVEGIFALSLYRFNVVKYPFFASTNIFCQYLHLFTKNFYFTKKALLFVYGQKKGTGKPKIKPRKRLIKRPKMLNFQHLQRFYQKMLAFSRYQTMTKNACIIRIFIQKPPDLLKFQRFWHLAL